MYGPPVSSNRLPASAKQSTTSAVSAAAMRYADGLAGPIKAATVAGRTKIPEPMTPLTAMAVRLRRPSWRVRAVDLRSADREIGSSSIRRSGDRVIDDLSANSADAGQCTD